MKQRPTKDEYAQYYEKYIDQVPEGDIIDIFENQQKSLMGFFTSIDEDKTNYRYAENKWSVKEVVGHILDAERIFAYRALRISRNDNQPLLSFNENEYVDQSNYSNISFEKIVDEFMLLRASNILMFKGFSDVMWTRKGFASNNPASVRALAYIMIGHTEHHIAILRERYKC